MTYALELIDVNKHLTDHGASNFYIKDVSFKMKKGFIMGFVGPNGSGKTTLIKLIMNLLKKDSGNIKILGLDNVEDETEAKDRIGFVYDDSYFYEELSMKEMTDIISVFYSKWDQDKYEDYMKKFNLNGSQRIKSLSKGMKIKYSLAIALSHNAELIIMDEPTDGLDPIFRREILEILQEFIEEGEKSVFFSTHITNDLDKIADYITLIDKGEIVFSESKEYIYDRYKLVKGGLEDITDELEKNLIGLKESRVGFEALIDTSNIESLEIGNLLIEEALLEDIMYFMNREDRQ